jgi:hypothetical protein
VQTEPLSIVIRKLRKLTPANLPVLASAGIVVVLVRLSLWFVPSRILLGRVSRMVTGAPLPADGNPVVRQVGWAVRAVSRRVPQASCLTQALATQILLARRGYSSQLRIGVVKEADAGFAAHAWVEIDGGILVGGTGAERYQVLPDLSPLLRDGW